MNKKRYKMRLLSLLIALVLLMSSLTAISPVASTVESAPTGTDYELADTVQEGAILHAWNWSYNSIKNNLQNIAQAGFSTVQVSPVQQPKDYNGSWTDIDGQWWKLYQPLSFSIARSSWLGGKSELTSLCTEAHKYGIKIICDIVANHMSNNGNNGSLDSNISNYESTLYNNQSQYFHSFVDCNDGSIRNVVQGNIGEPDLNTSNSYVQERVTSLLKECIDCGADGFRFDAAKHIETPSDNEYASNFWPNVLGAATSYANSKSGKKLFYYGEILNTVGSGRSYGSYSSYMSVTDNVTGDNIMAAVKDNRASSAATSRFNCGLSADKIVLWAESHDTYAGDSGSSGYKNTSKIGQDVIDKAYCLEISRNKVSALYLARPQNSTMGNVGSTSYKGAAVTAANKFHNYFIGANESMSSSGSLAICERYSSSKGTGCVIVNCSGNNTSVSGVSVGNMKSGTYTDTVTGGTFTVNNGKISGSIGSTGVAVIYNKTVVVTPTNTISQAGGSFNTDTLTLTLGLSNASSGTYKIGTGNSSTYSGTKSISIGSNMSYGDSVTVYLTATDNSTTTNASYTFKKVDPNMSIPFENSRVVYMYNTAQWNTASIYAWNGGDANSAWPGVDMTLYDTIENIKLYKYTLPENCTNLIFSNRGSSQTADLSLQSGEVYWDNSKSQWLPTSNLSGGTSPTIAPTTPPTSAVPTSSPTTISGPPTAGYYLVGKLNNEKLWETNDLDLSRKLERNTSNNQEEYQLNWNFYAGDEFKIIYYNGNNIERWFKDGMDNNFVVTSDNAGYSTLYFNPAGRSDWSYTYLTLIKNAVKPTTATTYLFGDPDLDGDITVQDVTLIQRTLAKIDSMTAIGEKSAKVCNNSFISITDATKIQLYLAKFVTSFPSGSSFVVYS